MWQIYKHTNLINNKCYIGQTCQDLDKRWKNGLGYKDSPKFYNAIQKYGWNNFSHEILDDNILTVEEADEKESYWINYYNSIDNGYNINCGGGKHSRGDEFAKKVSMGQKENWKNNKERKEKARNKLKEKWQDKEFREKFIGSNNGNSKKIICIENGLIFSTVNEASIWAKTSRQNITGVLKNRQKTAAGYHWKYVDNKNKEE